MGDKRAQDQGVRNVIDQAQVGQRLAGHLAQRFTGYQRLYAVALSDFRRCTNHHTFKDHAHLTVVDFLQDLANHRLKVDRDKTHAMRATKAVPQIMRHLTNADFMRCAAEIKEAVVHTATATHQHIAGHAGVETTGNQRQYIFLRPDRETANTFIAAFNQQQTVVFDFKINRHVRLRQLHARGFNMLVQSTANIAFHLNRAKLMLTATLNAYAEGFAFQLIAILHQRFLENIVHIGKRHVFNFENMVDPRNTGQRVANIQALAFIFSANLNVIPVADNGKVFIIVL